jgi:hypothetical protein
MTTQLPLVFPHERENNSFSEGILIENWSSINSQCAMVLGYLRQHGSINANEALQAFGIMRLAARIHDLKSSNYKIESVKEGKGVRYYYRQS